MALRLWLLRGRKHRAKLRGGLGVCVLAGNKAGQRFYERWGARRIGAQVVFCINDQPIMDILYRFANL